MALFVLSVSGYEEYRPVWFRKNCFIDEFREASRNAIAQAIKKLVKKKHLQYINGDAILDVIVPIMKKMGFEVVRPESEIDLKGECLYSDEKYARPEIIDDETWKLIIENNKKVDSFVYDNRKKRSGKSDK